MIKVASIQMGVGDQGKAELIRRAEVLLDQAAGFDLVLLPEIWNIGYFSFDFYSKESESIGGETTQRISAKAKAHGFYLHMGSFIEKKDDQLYNTSLLIDSNGNIIGIYRKIHLFGYGSKESQILSRGKDVVVVETALGRMGMCTCYDLRFPELFRAMLEKGAELFLVTSGWPYPRLEHWIMFNRIRAIENTAFLVSSNCVGINRGVQFCGHSMIVNPWGVIVTSGGDEECVLKAEIDIAEVSRIRKVFPAVGDRVLPC
jgi:predicted amidohydrolase